MKRWTKTLCRYRLDHKVCIETVVEHMDRSTSNKTVRDRRWGVETAGALARLFSFVRAEQLYLYRATSFAHVEMLMSGKGGLQGVGPLYSLSMYTAGPRISMIFFSLVLSAWFFFWRGLNGP